MKLQWETPDYFHKPEMMAALLHILDEAKGMTVTPYINRNHGRKRNYCKLFEPRLSLLNTIIIWYKVMGTILPMVARFYLPRISFMPACLQQKLLVCISWPFIVCLGNSFCCKKAEDFFLLKYNTEIKNKDNFSGASY